HAKTNAQWRQQFMTWEQEMKEQVKERAEVLALELVEERAEELAQELAEEAREETRAEVAVETARNFLAMGISPEKVAQGTGLPLAQVEQLRQEASAVEA
ncbi:MAG: hypothetical protein K2I74_07980, partial [Treponemataceae bacterium]|nr:hypothetical protein [Treponemataceae bacterium]